VLVHGSMDRGAAFARVVGHLRDLHTVRYDRRGYGRSTGLGAPDLAGHADDLLAIIGDRPAVVVGHSVGGVIALMAAQRAPELVRAVGAYEAPMPWVDWWPRRTAGALAWQARDPADGAELFLRRMIGDDRWEALSTASRADRRAEGPALLAELASARSGPAYDLAAIRVPVLIARGTAGAEHHRDATKALAEAVGTEPFLIEGAQHGGHVSHHAAFAAFVRTVVDAARA
jgi:pimeloyl-ACP methyl ester carboxylesterase